MSVVFRITDEHDKDVETLGGVLGEHNANAVGPADRKLLAVLAHGSDRSLIAGLSGFTAWQWLYVQWLWVGPSRRGQGMAGKLLDKAEAEARNRGCVGAHIDTFSPQALRVYERQGYSVFGAIPDFIAGQTRSFLKKRWAVSPPSATPAQVATCETSSSGE